MRQGLSKSYFSNADPMNTPPVLFLIFNRPDLTEQSFQEIRKARPRHLFVAADGPRNDRPGEADACQQAREIVEQIDWHCEVKTLFRDINLGCREAVSIAITWFFEHVEEGIVLEDDCVADPSFFSFCGELLERYRYDDRVMCVTGNNFQDGKVHGEASYYFSVFPHIWGWASWRRAWQKNDIRMKQLQQFMQLRCLEGLFSEDAARYWANKFRLTERGDINTWDYIWVFTCWAENGLTATPNVNLVSNIGFDGRGTHLTQPSKLAALPRESLTQLSHPATMLRSVTADEYVMQRVFNVPSASTRLSPPVKNVTRISRFRQLVHKIKNYIKASIMMKKKH